jgi:hypothetical protein
MDAPEGLFATTEASETGTPPELTAAVIVTVWPRLKAVPELGLEIETEIDEDVLIWAPIAIVKTGVSKRASSGSESNFEPLIRKSLGSTREFGLLTRFDNSQE